MSDFNFFFNDSATAEIYTLSLHDALPISARGRARTRRRAARRAHPPRDVDGLRLAPRRDSAHALPRRAARARPARARADRKSTRLNSSHANISYAVFCLKKNQ